MNELYQKYAIGVPEPDSGLLRQLVTSYQPFSGARQPERSTMSVSSPYDAQSADVARKTLPELAEKLGMFGANFAPGSGEYLSAQQSAEDTAKAREAFAQGNYGEAAASGANALVNAVGSLPIAHQAIAAGKGAIGLAKGLLGGEHMLMAGAPFFSAAERSIKQLSGESIKGQSLPNALRKLGVTEAEIKDLGVMELAKNRANDKITKAELENLVSQRGFKLGEEVLGSNENKPVQFPRYKAIPGEGDAGTYREGFVTLEDPTTRRISYTRPPNMGELAGLPAAEQQRIIDEYRATGSYTPVQDTEVFSKWKDPHDSYSGIENPIGRYRYDIQTLPDGRQVMRVHEFQAAYDKPKVTWEIIDPNGIEKSFTTGDAAKASSAKEHGYTVTPKQISPVPESLRERTYDLLVKKVLAEAKAQGLDGVTWSTGAQQVDLYSNALRNVANEARWNPDTKEFQLFKNGQRVTGEGIPTHVKDASEMENIIGKAATQRVMESKNTIPIEDDLLYRFGYVDDAQLGYYTRSEAKELAERKLDNLRRNNPEKTYELMQGDDFSSFEIYQVNKGNAGFKVTKDLSIDKQWPSKLYGDFSEPSRSLAYVIEDMGPIELAELYNDYKPDDVRKMMHLYRNRHDFGKSIKENIINGDLTPGDKVYEDLYYVLNRANDDYMLGPSVVERLGKFKSSGEFNTKARIPSLFEKYGKGKVEVSSDINQPVFWINKDKTPDSFPHYADGGSVQKFNDGGTSSIEKDIAAEASQGIEDALAAEQQSGIEAELSQQSPSIVGLLEGMNAPSNERLMTPAAEKAPVQQATKPVQRTTKPVQRVAKTLNIPAMVTDAANRFGVPLWVAHGVASSESGYDPNATSSAGAGGVMQLMPSTAKLFGVTNIHDPRQNINAGMRYLSELIDKYKGNYSLALAAYNAGPTNVARYNGIPPFKETQAYVAKVLQHRNKKYSEGGRVASEYNPEKIKSLADAITNLTLDREKEDQPTYEALTTEESNQPNNREWRTPDISEGMPRLASAHINRGALKLGDVNLGVNVSGRSKSGAENYRQHAVDVTLPVGRGNVQVSRSRYSDPYSSDTGLRTVYNTYLGDSQYSPTLNMMLEKYKSKKHPSVGVELSFPFGKGGKVSSDDILTKIEKLIRKGQYAVADMIGVKPETKFATEVSERYFPNEEHNERADAMRHMLFQAQLYKRSPLLSNAVGWAHENTALTQPDEEREMDEYNDVLGRGIAITSDDEPQTLVRKALEAIQSGKAKYMTPEENARLRRESAYAAGGSVAQYNPEKIDEIVNQIREAIHG